MERYQAQAYASHCVITRVPVEILTQILQEDNLSNGDYAAVASTCRYLRAIATPLLFHTLIFAARDVSSFAPLEAIAQSENKGALVRTISCTEPNPLWEIPRLEAVVYSAILVSALNVMSSLTSLEIPFATLNRTVFDAIYSMETLKRLFVSPIKTSQFALDLACGRRNDPPRRTPLVIPSLRGPDAEYASHHPYFACLENFLSFLDLWDIKVQELLLEPFFLFDTEPPATFLTIDPFSNLVELSVGCLPHGHEDLVEWLTDVLAAQIFLETVTLEVLDYYEGFELGRHTWTAWLDGQSQPPFPELELAWAGTRPRHLTLVYEREIEEEEEDDSDVWRISSIELVLPGDTVLTPRQMGALAQEACSSASLTIRTVDERATIGWSDWPATVAALLSHTYYGWISLQTSVTPTATISTTIACCPTCYETLLATHPASHAACELIGGPVALWTLAVNLNIERLRLLGQGTDIHLVPDVLMLVRGSEGALVEIDGTVIPPSKRTGTGVEAAKLRLLSVAPAKPIEARLLECECFVCSNSDDEDPILAVRRCGVKEVRAALAIGGFDLAAFDNRPPTEPIDSGSFETFLRTMT